MGDRWERRNPLVDQAVDVDAAVVPAPPPPDPDAPPDPVDGSSTLTDGLGDLDATEQLDAADGTATGDEVVDDDEDLEEADGRFARRNPLIDRTLGPT